VGKSQGEGDEKRREEDGGVGVSHIGMEALGMARVVIRSVASR
jgi:hypothetical protein